MKSIFASIKLLQEIMVCYGRPQIIKTCMFVSSLKSRIQGKKRFEKLICMKATCRSYVLSCEIKKNENYLYLNIITPIQKNSFQDHKKRKTKINKLVEDFYLHCEMKYITQIRTHTCRGVVESILLIHQCRGRRKMKGR